MGAGLRMLKVAEHRTEGRSTRTVMVSGHLEARPAQFVMVWVPGTDEFPMSLSYTGDQPGITYQVLGEGTRALAETPVGGVLGLRGPYGKGFEVSGKRALVVAGGVGIAPLAPLVEEAVEAGVEVDLVLGARTADELVFEERCSRSGAKVHVSTDDGTKGEKGFATDLADRLLDGDRFDSVYACGPERMITALVGNCRDRGLPLQASLERFMKCGIGLCDSCAIDGKHVCTDGPVFAMDDLMRLSELGRTRLDRTGRRVDI